MPPIKPHRLLAGDHVAVVSPSGPVVQDAELFRRACEVVEEQLNVKIELGRHALGKRYYSSGTVAERLSDLHCAFANPAIKAILFSTGGGTAIELLEHLDYDLIAANPKIVSGISDGTTLINALAAKTGLITFHGMEFVDFARTPMPYTFASMRQLWRHAYHGPLHPNPNWQALRGATTTYSERRTVRPGSAHGHIVGGNYDSFMQLRDTGYLPSLDGAILVIEIYKHSKRDIHRALARLRLWNIFDRIAGLIMGYCIGSDDEGVTGNERDMVDLLHEVTEGYAFPVVQIGEIGHWVENLMVPIGAMATLDTGSMTFSLEESCVL